MSFLFLGNGSVGKTSMIRNLLGGAFLEQLPPSLGIDYSRHTWHVTWSQEGRWSYSKSGTLLTTVLWDLAGQVGPYTNIRNYVRHKDGIFIVGELGERIDKTIGNMRTWYERVQREQELNVISSHTPIIFVFNKCDRDPNGLPPRERANLEKSCPSKGIYITSAKTGQNLRKLLLAMINCVTSAEKDVIKEKRMMTSPALVRVEEQSRSGGAKPEAKKSCC